MRLESSGLGFGLGVGAGVGLAVGDGLRVGVGEGLGLGVARATGFWADTRLHATTTTISATTTTAARTNVARASRFGGIRANIGRHDTWCMQSREVTVETGGRRGVYDLTDACAGFLDEVSAGRDGLLHAFVPHATAGLLVMEMGSGSEEDVMESLDRLLPRDDHWVHRHGPRGHGADHLVPLLAASSVSIPVLQGRMALGTWQSIALLDPNAEKSSRQVRLSFVPA
jgi:secondary thiamine-phosphate synthase enzyme